MAYDDFSLDMVKQQFGLWVRQERDLFGGASPALISDLLRQILEEKTCDFLLSLSPLQLTVEAPVVAVVEAKNDSIKSGLGQCLAEMVAAQSFNERRGNAIPTVYGVVTTGSLRKFLRLAGADATVDEREHHITDVGRIVGVLLAMVRPPVHPTPVTAPRVETRA